MIALQDRKLSRIGTTLQATKNVELFLRQPLEGALRCVSGI